MYLFHSLSCPVSPLLFEICYKFCLLDLAVLDVHGGGHGGGGLDADTRGAVRHLPSHVVVKLTIRRDLSRFN